MKNWLRNLLVICLMLAFFDGNAIVKQSNGITYNSSDEKISAEIVYLDKDGYYVRYKVNLSFSISFLFDKPMLFTLTIHKIPGTGPFPEWFKKIEESGKGSGLVFFFNEGAEDYKMLQCFLDPEQTDAHKFTVGCKLVDDTSIITKMMQEPLSELVIVGPGNFDKEKKNERCLIGKFSRQPRDIFVKIWNTEHQDFEREEAQKQQNQQQSQSQQQQNRQQQQSAPQSTSPYGDLVFHGYTYEWNDFHQHASERDNGKLTLQTRASHYIGVMFNSHVTNISPDRKSSTIWSTRNGAIKVPLPKGVSTNKTDEVIVWENTGSNGSKSTVAFAYNPSTQTLQVIYHCKRQWQGKTLNDRFYFRTRDAAAWQQIKSRLMQELPYCANRIN